MRIGCIGWTRVIRPRTCQTQRTSWSVCYRSGRGRGSGTNESFSHGDHGGGSCADDAGNQRAAAHRVVARSQPLPRQMARGRAAAQPLPEAVRQRRRRGIRAAHRWQDRRAEYVLERATARPTRRAAWRARRGTEATTPRCRCASRRRSCRSCRSVWGDYWVIGLGPDYTWAVVGTPSREYLWILSRTPTHEQSAYEQAIEIAKGNGFDMTALQKTPHGCRADGRRRLTDDLCSDPDRAGHAGAAEPAVAVRDSSTDTAGDSPRRSRTRAPEGSPS